MNKAYNFIWDFTMLATLALILYHLWMNRQGIINTLFY